MNIMHTRLYGQGNWTEIISLLMERFYSNSKTHPDFELMAGYMLLSYKIWSLDQFMGVSKR